MALLFLNFTMSLIWIRTFIIIKKIGCLSKETGSDKGCHRQAG